MAARKGLVLSLGFDARGAFDQMVSSFQGKIKQMEKAANKANIGDNLGDQFEALKKQLDEAKSMINGKKLELDDANSLLSKNKEKLDSANTELNKAKELIDENKSLLEEKKVELDLAKTKIDESKNELNKKMNKKKQDDMDKIINALLGGLKNE